MSGSDKIKDALVAAYPGTVAKDWKRRTKQKVDGRTQRDFEHATHGLVATFEDDAGNISLDGSVTPVMNTAQPTVAKTVKEPTVAKTVKEAVPISEPVSVGDRMQIPAGVRVFELSYSMDSVDEASVAKRAITATASGIVQITNWVTLAPESNIAEIEAAMRAASGRDQTGSVQYILGWIENELSENNFGSWYGRKVYSGNLAIDAALQRAKQAVAAEFGENPEFVTWGKGSSMKCAFRSLVVKLDPAPVAEKAPKEAKITKRRLMVEDSTWRFARDVEIKMWVENPKIWQLVSQRDSISRSGNSQHMQGSTRVIVLGGGVPNTPAEKRAIDDIQAEINRLQRDEPQVLITTGTITAGTVIRVMGKLAPEYSYGDKKTNGLLVPCIVESGGITALSRKLTCDFYLKAEKGAAWDSNRVSGFELPFRQIEDAIEAEQVPETIVYVLRDRETKEFFGGWETESDGRWERGTNRPKMSMTFSGAKKYKTSSAVKASIRDFTGYNSGINDDGEYSPEWATNRQKKIDLPETWEMVAIDKTTNVEKEVIDVQDWFKNLMRLRVLTQKHCSAVRAAYKKAEESDDTFEAIIMFQMRDKGSTTYYNGNTSSWDQAVPFEDMEDEGTAALAAINDAANNMAGKTIRVKTQSAVAYACSLDDGILAKLSFMFPDVEVRLLDIVTLEDVVESGEQVAKPITHEYIIDGVKHSY